MWKFGREAFRTTNPKFGTLVSEGSRPGARWLGRWSRGPGMAARRGRLEYWGTDCLPRGTDSAGAKLTAGAIGVLTARVGKLMCGRRFRRREPAGRPAVNLWAGVFAVRRQPERGDPDGKSGATHANNNAGTVVAGNVTKGQPDPLGRGRKRAAAGRSSCRAVADATMHHCTLGSGRHEARCSRAVPSKPVATAATLPDPGWQWDHVRTPSRNRLRTGSGSIF